MSSTHVLSHKHVFGFHSGVAQNCAFVDPNTVAYVAGYQVVFSDTEDRSQRFINSFVPAGGVELDGFTCLALSPDASLLAVAERGEKPQINIFDTKTRRKRKNLVHQEAVAKCSVLAMAFTQSGDNLVVLTGKPDCALVVFAWKKAKAIYDCKLAEGHPGGVPAFDLFTRLSLNPLDTEDVTAVVLGPRSLNFFRLTEDQALPIKTPTQQLLKGAPAGTELTCAAWLREPADTVVVGSSEGKLALYTGGVFQAFLAPCLPPGVAATALLSLASGLVVGASDGGLRFLEVIFASLIRTCCCCACARASNGWGGGLEPGVRRQLRNAPPLLEHPLPCTHFVMFCFLPSCLNLSSSDLST